MNCKPNELLIDDLFREHDGLSRPFGNDIDLKQVLTSQNSAAEQLQQTEMLQKSTRKHRYQDRESFWPNSTNVK